MSTPVPRQYDLVVVGAGSGGYVAGIRAAQLGMTVAIIEERYWGGVCLNTGCVPSKALLRNAEIASILTHQADEFGICGDIKLDYARAVSRSREVADARVRGVHFLMRKNRITEIDGRGRFSGSHTLDVHLRDGGTTSLRFDNAIIATGSRVRMLPGVTLSENIVTYEQQILDATIPSPSSSSAPAESAWNSPTSSTATASTSKFSSTPTAHSPTKTPTSQRN